MQGLIVLGVLVALILLSSFSSFNIGTLAVFAALVLGKLLLGMRATEIASLIQAGTLLNLISLAVFYGFAMENGTAEALIQKVLYRFGKNTKFLPILIFFVSAGMSMAGLGCGNATMIMAPVAMNLATPTGISPLVMATAVACGAAAGGNFPFSYGGLVAAALIEEAGIVPHPAATVMGAAIRNFAVNTVGFCLLFLLQKGKRTTLIVPEAPPLNPIQKKTGCLICAIMICVITPSIFSLLLPCKFTRKLSSILDTSTVLIGGIIAASAMHLAPEREVLKKHVPWMLLIVISGMSMLVGIAQKCGIIEYLGTALNDSVPSWMMKYIVLLIGMTMSLFAGAISVVIPTLYPLIPAIGANAAEIGILYGATLTGATCGGICPYSSGGMVLLGAYPDAQGRRKLLLQLLLMPIYLIVIACVVYTI